VASPVCLEKWGNGCYNSLKMRPKSYETTFKSAVKSALFHLLCLLLPAWGLAPGLVHASTAVKGVLSKDTVWKPSGNPYLIQSDFTIPTGIKLTIEPGCDVRLAPTGSFDTTEMGTSGNDILVLGTIRAQGTPEYPISFSSTSGDKRWGSIYFGSPTQSLLSCAYVLNGKIICNGSSPEISHCCIYGGGGVEIGHNSSPKIADCVMDKNSSALLYWFTTSGGEVTGNKIFRNRYGIYVKEFASLTIANNAIYDNTDYNVCNLSAQHAVDVRNNWWGTTFPLAVEQRIYDGRKKEGLGWVVFSPILEAEVAVALLAPPPFLQPAVPTLSEFPVAPETEMLAPGSLMVSPMAKPTPQAPSLEVTPGKSKGGQDTGAVAPPPKPTPTPVPEDNGPWKTRW